jgi:prophage regulatory protein
MTKLLRLPGVKTRTGLTTTEIYEAQKEGTFPASVRISERCVAWVETEINEWIAQRIAQRDSQPPYRVREERARRAGPGRGKTGPRIATTEL